MIPFKGYRYIPEKKTVIHPGPTHPPTDQHSLPPSPHAPRVVATHPPTPPMGPPNPPTDQHSLPPSPPAPRVVASQPLADETAIVAEVDGRSLYAKPFPLDATLDKVRLPSSLVMGPAGQPSHGAGWAA